MAGEGARKGITIARVERQYIRTRARIIRHECQRGTKRKLGSSTQRWTCFLMGSSARINILGGLETTTRTRVRAVGTDVSIWLTALPPPLSLSLSFAVSLLTSLYLVSSSSTSALRAITSSFLRICRGVERNVRDYRKIRASSDIISLSALDYYIYSPI